MQLWNKFLALLSLLFLLINSEALYSQVCGLDTSFCYSSEPYPTVSFGSQLAFESAANTVVFQTPLVVDIDSDCIPEIIMSGTTSYTNSNGTPRLTSGIIVVNSTNGNTISSFPTVDYSWTSTLSYAVADVNSDGTPEIVIAAANVNSNPVATRGKLVCYDFSGNVIWISDQNFGNNTILQFDGTPGFADFNQDGSPEVYIHNQIFNAETGVMLADGGSNGIGQMGWLSGYFEICQVAAGDLDSDPSDLELAAGFTIYDVQITNPNGVTGNTMTPFSITVDGSLRDGLTSLADINMDGKLDVVVSTGGTEITSRLYAYYLDNTNNPVLIARVAMPRATTAPGSIYSGPPLVSDIDGLGTPSICVTRNYRLLAYEYNGTTTFQQKWVLTTVDNSGCTGITSFDFDQDGLEEIVFRDEQNLTIINGNGSSPTILSTTNCGSLTVCDMPVVADIDNSGSTKICVTCGTDPSKLKVFESNAAVPWAPSRGIWNQFGYNYTNINDDATVPQFLENNATLSGGAYNNFYVQASALDSLGNYLVPAAEASVSIDCITNDQINDELTISYTVSNSNTASQSLLPNLNMSLFDGDPESTGTLINLQVLNSTITQGGSISGSFVVSPIPNISNTDLYLVINNDGSSVGSPFSSQDFNQIECDYSNNIDSFPFSPINAGLDTSFCDLQPIIDLNGSSSGLNASWTLISGLGTITDSSLNSTSFSPTGYGVFSFEYQLFDSSCVHAIDDLTVTINELPNISPAPDESICIGDTVQIGLTSGSQYDYLWTPASSLVSPNTDSQPFSSPSTSELYIQQITNPLTGCIAFDSVLVSVLPEPIFTPLDDTTICTGSSLFLEYQDSIQNTFSWNPINLNAPTFSGVINNSEVFIVTVTDTASGCTALDSITISTFNFPTLTTPNYGLCIGDSFQINLSNNPNLEYHISVDSINFSSFDSTEYFSPQTNGYYLIQATDTLADCSWIDSVLITVYPNPLLQVSNDTTICIGNSVQLNAFSDPQNTITWNGISGNPLNVTPILGLNQYVAEVTTPNGCTALDTVIVETIANPNASFIFNPNTILENGTLVNLTNLSENATSYSWFINGEFYSTELNPLYYSENTNQEFVTITLIAYNEFGCLDSITQNIPIYLEPFIYVPNSFTPNDDEHNNVFHVVVSGKILDGSFELEIYDRWGELIYVSQDYLEGWDATYLGKPVQDGIYTWKVRYTGLISNQTEKLVGHVSILR